MWTLYESILSLCQENGIKGGKMWVDLGLSKSLMTDLKSGRKKGITAETAQKIADYFSVSVDRVLNGPETKKAPTDEGERIPHKDKRELLAGRGVSILLDADAKLIHTHEATGSSRVVSTKENPRAAMVLGFVLFWKFFNLLVTSK